MKVLLVDDDPVVLRMYQDGLSYNGVLVDIAADGSAAIEYLRESKPDVVVLDLMMPDLTGVDVLKFIRAEASLEGLPVVVLSNSYMNRLAVEASALGVQKALLKIQCSPSVLIEAMDEVLAGESNGAEKPTAPPAQSPSGPSASTPPERPHEPARNGAAQFHAKTRRQFLHDGPGTCTELRGLCQAVITAASEEERAERLQSFYRKVHLIAATAGLAECHQIAQITSALEAMLFELMDRPDAFSPSVLRTIAATVDSIALLFDCAQATDSDLPLSAQALVVDDDPLNNRLAVSALQLAHLKVDSSHDPADALKRLQENHYDLVLLDIQMPTLDGFELCRNLRKLPGYKKTLVVYVTGHSDFDTRAKSALSGGDDLISKPVFPLELTVKAVAHLLKLQMAA